MYSANVHDDSLHILWSGLLQPSPTTDLFHRLPMPNSFRQFEVILNYMDARGPPVNQYSYMDILLSGMIGFVTRYLLLIPNGPGSAYVQQYLYILSHLSSFAEVLYLVFHFTASSQRIGHTSSLHCNHEERQRKRFRLSCR